MNDGTRIRLRKVLEAEEKTCRTEVCKSYLTMTIQTAPLRVTPLGNGQNCHCELSETFWHKKIPFGTFMMALMIWPEGLTYLPAYYFVHCNKRDTK